MASTVVKACFLIYFMFHASWHQPQLVTGFWDISTQLNIYTILDKGKQRLLASLADHSSSSIDGAIQKLVFLRKKTGKKRQQNSIMKHHLCKRDNILSITNPQASFSFITPTTSPKCLLWKEWMVIDYIYMACTIRQLLSTSMIWLWNIQCNIS